MIEGLSESIFLISSSKSAVSNLKEEVVYWLKMPSFKYFAGII